MLQRVGQLLVIRKLWVETMRRPPRSCMWQPRLRRRSPSHSCHNIPYPFIKQSHKRRPLVGLGSVIQRFSKCGGHNPCVDWMRDRAHCFETGVSTLRSLSPFDAIMATLDVDECYDVMRFAGLAEQFGAPLPTLLFCFGSISEHFVCRHRPRLPEEECCCKFSQRPISWLGRRSNR